MISKFTFKTSWRYIFDELNVEQKGKLIEVMISFSEGLEPNIVDDVIRVAFAPIKAELEYEIRKRKRISKLRAEAGRKGGEKSGLSRKKVSAKPKMTVNKAFSAPNLPQIQEYILENKLNVDPNLFFNHYTKYDWKIKGKTMESWEAAVMYWHENPRSPSKYKKEKVSHKDYLS